VGPPGPHATSTMALRYAKYLMSYWYRTPGEWMSEERQF
jgi:hypothetical protein